MTSSSSSSWSVGFSRALIFFFTSSSGRGRRRSARHLVVCQSNVGDFSRLYIVGLACCKARQTWNKPKNKNQRSNQSAHPQISIAQENKIKIENKPSGCHLCGVCAYHCLRSLHGRTNGDRRCRTQPLPIEPHVGRPPPSAVAVERTNGRTNELANEAATTGPVYRSGPPTFVALVCCVKSRKVIHSDSALCVWVAFFSSK